MIIQIQINRILIHLFVLHLHFHSFCLLILCDACSCLVNGVNPFNLACGFVVALGKLLFRLIYFTQIDET